MSAIYWAWPSQTSKNGVCALARLWKKVPTPGIGLRYLRFEYFEFFGGALLDAPMQHSVAVRTNQRNVLHIITLAPLPLGKRLLVVRFNELVPQFAIDLNEAQPAHFTPKRFIALPSTLLSKFYKRSLSFTAMVKNPLPAPFDKPIVVREVFRRGDFAGGILRPASCPADARHRPAGFAVAPVPLERSCIAHSLGEVTSLHEPFSIVVC